MATDLAIIEKDYPVLVPGSKAAQLIAANTIGESIDVTDLDRIRVPAGGGLAWTVPTASGEDSVKNLEGVIVHVARRRAYWADPEPKGTVPDCYSKDGVTGIGTPGGNCDSCPMNAFGTAVRPGGAAGRGKACKEMRLLFLLRPGENLPAVVVVPPGSLKGVKSYLLKLKAPFWRLITRLTLTKAQSKDGIAYAQIKPEMVSDLGVEAAGPIKRFADQMRSLFEGVKVDRELYDDAAEIE